MSSVSSSDSSKILPNFHDRLKFARAKQGLTQRQVAQVAGITERNYISYESGVRKPNFDTAITVARVLRVSLDYLAGLTPRLETADATVAELDAQLRDDMFDKYLESRGHDV